MLVIEGSSLCGRPLGFNRLVIILYLFPPRKLPQRPSSPFCFCNASEVFEVGQSGGLNRFLAETTKCNPCVNQNRLR